MPRRTSKFGNMTFRHEFDFAKRRSFLANKRREAGYSELTMDRVRRELDDLEVMFKNKGGCPKDAEATFGVIHDLRQRYEAFLATNFPELEITQRVVIAELCLLKKCIGYLPSAAADLILERLEDLYVSSDENMFTGGLGNMKERYTQIGDDIRSKIVSVRWQHFPIMETFFAERELIERLMLQNEVAVLRMMDKGPVAEPLQGDERE